MYVSTMMAAIHINIPDELNTKFRVEIFKRRDQKRGYLTNALIEAIELWINENEGGIQ